MQEPASSEMRLHLDDEGPGSFNEILEYIEKVLEDNWVPGPDNTRLRPHFSSARAITISVCSRLGIKWSD